MIQALFSKENRTKIFYIAATGVILYLVIKYHLTIGAVLKPFMIAAVISYLLNPIVQSFEKKGIRRIFSVLIVYLIFILLILLISFFLIPRLVKDIGVLIQNLPQYTGEIQGIIKRFQDGYINSNLPQGFKDIIDENINTIQALLLYNLQKVADSIIGIFSEVFNIVLVPIITFYLLKDVNYFKNQLILLIPQKKRIRILLLFRDIDNVFGRFIRGQLIVASFVGIMTTVGLLLVKVNYAIILGLFAGISNIIPYFGPFIGIIPTVITALLESPTKALYAAGVFLLVQQVESGILSPKIIGESVGIHPIYVMLSLVIGGKLLGIVGLIVAVPALVAVKLTLRHVLRGVGIREKSGGH